MSSATQTSPSRASRQLESGGDWDRLTRQPTPTERFSSADVAGLPEPVARWLRHSVPDGTPLHTGVELEMRGEIKLGSWRRFTARQVIVPGHGYVWAARVRLAGLTVSGYDELLPAGAQMRWWALGVLPFLNKSGPDITSSAAGRLASEGVLVPTAYHQATWLSDALTDYARSSWSFGEHEDAVRVHVTDTGRLASVSMHRWGNPDDVGFARYPFGVSFSDEATFDGVTIPSAMRASWWWGTDWEDKGEFFRARITRAVFR
jgi:hypothetical protein